MIEVKMPLPPASRKIVLGVTIHLAHTELAGT